MVRDVGRYARPDRFDNPDGGRADQAADIQFDTMGVDFGSWLRRFKNQVERNWIIPAAVMSFRGRVVVRFVVLKTGTLIELQILQPASEPSLTAAAVNALKLSNPTAALPTEYPADRMPITVTFHYNEDPRSAR
jgi:TonB family protein